MNVFAGRFRTTWGGNTISYSAKSMAFRVGNEQFEIDANDLSDLENAQAWDITVSDIQKAQSRSARRISSAGPAAALRI